MCGTARETGPTEARVNLPDAEIWTETTGKSGPAVVLCHGGPGLCDILGPVAAMIDDIAVVHRYDQRGAGRSTGAGPYTVRGFVEDLEALRQHWGHQRWVVGGHSWGGWLALMYAIAHPDRVSALIGIGVPPPPSEGWSDEFLEARNSRLTPEERALLDDVRRRRREGTHIDDDDERRFVHALWKTEFADPEAAPDFDADPLFDHPANYEVNRQVVADMDGMDAESGLVEQLRAVAVPALFIHGSSDPRPAPRSVVAAISPADLIEVPGAGHVPWLETANDVRTAMRSFLTDVPT